jgi:hypothetical protein
MDEAGLGGEDGDGDQADCSDQKTYKDAPERQARPQPCQGAKDQENRQFDGRRFRDLTRVHFRAWMNGHRLILTDALRLSVDVRNDPRHPDTSTPTD